MNDHHKTMLLVLVVSILFIGLIFWNMTITYKAMDIANHAYRKAGMGHPEYLTLEATENEKKTHDTRHRRETASYRRDITQQTKLINLELSRRIDKIPASPPQLEALCDDLDKRILKLEIKGKKS